MMEENEPPDINSINKTPSLSYANAASNNQHKFPTKQQAIVFNSLTNIKMEEYLFAIGSKIQPQNIIFSSRVSNNRIVVYFSRKEIVDDFFNQHGGMIKINDEYIQTRKLITPSERLLMSNVSPTIPHNVLEKELQNLNIKLSSTISFLRIGSSNPEYRHILSFRRQVFISPPEDPLPDSILITHENINYRIFLSIDNLCFHCKQHGHLSNNCTQSKSNSTNNINNNSSNFPPITVNQSDNSQPIKIQSHLNQKIPDQQITPTHENAEHLHAIQTASNEPNSSTQPVRIQQQQPNSNKHLNSSQFNVSQSDECLHQQGNNETPKNKYNKRNISDVAVSPPTTPSENKVFTKPEDNKPKKPKHTKTTAHNKESKTQLEEMLTAVKDLFITEKQILSFEETVDFFENIQGSKDILSIANSYNPNTILILQLLSNIHSATSNRQLKTKCTKTKRKIIKQLNVNTTELDLGTESDTSLESSLSQSQEFF